MINGSLLVPGVERVFGDGIGESEPFVVCRDCPLSPGTRVEGLFDESNDEADETEFPPGDSCPDPYE
jgi:hypothetical protein